MWAGPRKAVRPDPLEQLRMAFFLQPILSSQKMSDTSVDKELEDPQELLDSTTQGGVETWQFTHVNNHLERGAS